MARYSGGEWAPTIPLIHIQVAAVCGLVILVFHLFGLYAKKTMSLLNIDQMRKLLRSFLFLAVLVFSVAFYFRVSFPRLFVTIWLILTFFNVTIVKMVFHKVHQYFHIKGLNIERVVIYGAGEIGRKLYKAIYSHPKLGCRAVGFLDDDLDMFAEELERVKVNGKSVPKILGTSGDLERIVRDCQIDELLIARKGLLAEEIIDLTNRCRNLNIRFKIVPQLLGGFVENLSFQEFAGIPLIGEKEARIRPSFLIVKRLMDIVLSLAACVLFLPALIVIAVLIRFDSPGPAIFRQKRIGKDGKEFTIHKFRTMFTDAPKYSYCPKKIKDPRISRIGRFLRKTSLDELPQFFDVLGGDMSIVGPRPEMPFIVAQYNALERKRLSMKPGITGLWQISADRDYEIHENIDYDLYYVENYSFLLDVAIIARTALYGLIAMKTS